MNDYCGMETNKSPVWGILDVFWWKVIPERIGGGRKYIQGFKDAWVIHNKVYIRSCALKYALPVELLAGVCWIETGGDPNSIDRVAFEVRAFERVLDLPSKITSHPGKTSFGWVSIQLRTAARTLGLNDELMTVSQLRELSNCLEHDIYNIDMAARHLRLLADHDGFSFIGLEEVKVIGARYNRGVELSLEAVKSNMSYGEFIVENWYRFNGLVAG